MIEHKCDFITYKCTHCGKWFQKKSTTIYIRLVTSNGVSENIGIFCSEKCTHEFENILFPASNNINFKRGTTC